MATTVWLRVSQKGKLCKAVRVLVALATQYHGASHHRLLDRNRDPCQHLSEHHTRPCLTPSSTGWRYSFLRGTSSEVEWPLWEACRWHESKSAASGVVPQVPRHEGRYAMLHGYMSAVDVLHRQQAGIPELHPIGESCDRKNAGSVATARLPPHDSGEEVCQPRHQVGAMGSDN
jgi:hypothetical protein